jgi:Fe-S-cluster containining protein
MIMELVRRDGFAYAFAPAACDPCGGRCCRGRSGHIWVSPAEIDRITTFLGVNRVDFLARSLRRIDNRLSLAEQWTGTEALCQFFDIPAGRCRIYPVRPRQCREFPFWDHFRERPAELARECPGVMLDSSSCL